MGREARQSHQATAKPVGMEKVGERLNAVDEHDGNSLAIAALELRVPGDVDLLQLEGSLCPHLREDAAGALAEVAAGSVEERDSVRPRGRAHA
jgi:hypothetical protein